MKTIKRLASECGVRKMKFEDYLKNIFASAHHEIVEYALELDAGNK